MKSSRGAQRAQLLRRSAIEALNKKQPAAALAYYEELAKLEPHDGEWQRRIAECYRELGDKLGRVDALIRAAELYSCAGFVTKAVAICKLVLALDPNKTDLLGRLMPQERTTNGDLELRRRRRDQVFAQVSQRSAPARATTESAAATENACAPPVATVDARRVSDEWQAVDDAEITPVRQATVQRETLRPGGAYAAWAERTSRATPRACPRVETHPKSLAEIEESAVVEQQAATADTLFAEFGRESLALLVKRSRHLQLAPGDIVLNQGDVSPALYVIIRGAVSVIMERDRHVETSRLGESAFFGEGVVAGGLPEEATIEALEPTELLVLDRRLIESLGLQEPTLAKQILQSLRARLVQRVLFAHHAFSAFSNAEKQALGARFEFLELDAGAPIIERGRPSPGLIVLTLGEFQLKKYDANGIERCLSLQTGSIVGDVALLSKQRSDFSVVSLTKSYALLLPARDLSELVMTHPQLLEFVSALRAPSSTSLRAAKQRITTHRALAAQQPRC